MGKGAFIKRMNGFSQKLQYNKHYNEKKKQTGKGVRLTVMNFQGSSKKLENSSGITHSVFH